MLTATEGESINHSLSRQCLCVCVCVCVFVQTSSARAQNIHTEGLQYVTALRTADDTHPAITKHEDCTAVNVPSNAEPKQSVDAGVAGLAWTRV